jgi:hypothetical protein
MNELPWSLDIGQGAHWHDRELNEPVAAMAGTARQSMRFVNTQYHAMCLQNGRLRTQAVACDTWLQRISWFVE